MGECCIKCPAIESFYAPNKIQNVLQGAYVTRQVSLVLSAFMAVSYLVLPGKRGQPHISVLFLTVSLSLWYAAFDVMPGISNACVDDFEQSTGHNSRLCGIQGVLIIYFTQTSALWCSLLIYKLHLVSFPLCYSWMALVHLLEYKPFTDDYPNHTAFYPLFVLSSRQFFSFLPRLWVRSLFGSLVGRLEK